MFLFFRYVKQPKVVVAVNKCESRTLGGLQAADFFGLGLGEPVGCSAIHGNGVAEVLEELVPVLYDVTEDTLKEQVRHMSG
jgi:GTP-binding protein